MAAPRPDRDEGTTAPLLNNQSDETSTLGPASSRSSSPSPTPSQIRKHRAANVARATAFASAVVSAFCSSSLTAFSLYGHIFQSRLHYSQYQVNGVAIAASLSLYLPVPFLGFVIDRGGPAIVSLFAALFFGAGYGLAAGLYKRSAVPVSGAHVAANGVGSGEYVLMVIAFICIGVGSGCMYLSSVATCAKNFGKGKYRGLALAVPIAACGLSGMWQSQVGSRVLYERMPDGSKGDVNVFHFFLFLAILLFAVGILGTFTLRIVNERDLIDEAVEEMERSGLLDGSSLLSGRGPRGYGALDASDLAAEEEHAGILDPAKDGDDEDAQLKKAWVLNAETRRYLTDPTMWLFAVGFLFMIGPGETFINNFGTVINSLYPPSLVFAGAPTSAATHVSIICFTSTAVRLLVGGLTDLLAPSPKKQHVQIPSNRPILHKLKFSVSRVTFLIFFALLTSFGMVILASGLIQNHGERFWIVSGLIGAGYGAIFSLTPIIVTIIWGVENFATNWGLIAMFPAVGATVWGLIYSAIYEAGVERDPGPGGNPDLDSDNFCYGTHCYAPTFWAMAGSVWVACVFVLLAWKGRRGWAQRGIVI